MSFHANPEIYRSIFCQQSSPARLNPHELSSVMAGDILRVRNCE